MEKEEGVSQSAQARTLIIYPIHCHTCCTMSRPALLDIVDIACRSQPCSSRSWFSFWISESLGCTDSTTSASFLSKRILNFFSVRSCARKILTPFASASKLLYSYILHIIVSAYLRNVNQSRLRTCLHQIYECKIDTTIYKNENWKPPTSTAQHSIAQQYQLSETSGCLRHPPA